MAGEIQLNSVTLATESGGTISLSGDVDTTTPTKTALNASGSAPVYACRAWVNFNGTGTVAIRASGNVSSITDNGTGDYTVNFTTAMSDANYCVTATSCPRLGGTDGGILFGVSAPSEAPNSSLSTTSVNVASRRASSAGSNAIDLDSDYCAIAVLR